MRRAAPAREAHREPEPEVNIAVATEEVSKEASSRRRVARALRAHGLLIGCVGIFAGANANQAPVELFVGVQAHVEIQVVFGMVAAIHT